MLFFDLFFPKFCRNNVEVRIYRSISESPLEFEITRVDCKCFLVMCLINPFMSSGLFYLNPLDRSITYIRLDRSITYIRSVWLGFNISCFVEVSVLKANSVSVDRDLQRPIWDYSLHVSLIRDSTERMVKLQTGYTQNRRRVLSTLFGQVYLSEYLGWICMTCICQRSTYCVMPHHSLTCYPSKHSL